MARRKKTSQFEDLIAIASMLPWWVSVILAVVAYGVLHELAAMTVSTDVGLNQVGGMVGRQLAKVLAAFGQYLIPLALLIGGAVSYFGRQKRASLLNDVAQSRSNAALLNMTWRDFELLVGETFRVRGFAVTETGGAGADGGIDLQLKKGGELFFVQCKQWRAYKVSVTVIRELYGVMTAKGATGGFVVTSGVFTRDAQEFAKGRNIELLDGAALASMIDKVPAALKTVPSTDNRVPASAASSSAAATKSSLEVSCPRCGCAMVRRIAKQGANVGNAFWGCSAFPKCRGVRAID